jgi:hypothetical protein
MHPADILKTAIITPFGLFEFLRLTFGLRNTGSTFQRLMDWVLAGLAFAFVYLDDIIIASPSMEQHQQDVEEVFQRLQADVLVINFEKCTFAVPEVDFLGHRVSASGFTPLPSRVAAIQTKPLTDFTRGRGDSGGLTDTADGGGFPCRQDRFGGGRTAGAPTARPD